MHHLGRRADLTEDAGQDVNGLDEDEVSQRGRIGDREQRVRIPEGGRLRPDLLDADTRRDLVTFQDPIRLVAVQSQGLGELVMRDPVPTVELDEECLLRLPAKVGPVAAKLVCDLRRYLEADGHGLSSVADGASNGDRSESSLPHGPRPGKKVG